MELKINTVNHWCKNIEFERHIKSNMRKEIERFCWKQNPVLSNVDFKHHDSLTIRNNPNRANHRLRHGPLNHCTYLGFHCQQMIIRRTTTYTWYICKMLGRSGVGGLNTYVVGPWPASWCTIRPCVHHWYLSRDFYIFISGDFAWLYDVIAWFFTSIAILRRVNKRTSTESSIE